MSVDPAVIDRWSQKILDAAGPGFEALDDAALAALQSFGSEDVELGGLSASRAAHGETDATKPDFDRRLAILGRLAAVEALDEYRLIARCRTAGFGDPVPESEFGVLSARHLFGAGGTVLPASGTGLCSPPKGG